MKVNRAAVTERFPRCSNIPATLLHIGMLGIDSGDEELCGAAYDLLRAVCTYLDYDKNPIVASKGSFRYFVTFCCPRLQMCHTPGGFIPGDPCAFVVNLSEQLAEFCPELTIDFISEVAAGMELVGDKGDDKAFARTSTAQRINCLQYMSPWVKNLVYFTDPTSVHYEHSGARLRDCVRVLSDLTIADTEVRLVGVVIDSLDRKNSRSSRLLRNIFGRK
jgi:hypothetical protein